MRKKTMIVAAMTVVLFSVGAATVYALTLHAGDLVIEAEGGFSPKALPRHTNAPITLHGGGKLSTASGALPPVLKELTILFDRHGSVVTTGLEVCTKGKLAATDTKTARSTCPGAIVGEGLGSAVVKFPEQGAIKASSPITLFNGPPKHGDPTVLAHAYLRVPAPTTYIVPVVIETIHEGIYGYRTKATIPPIAGGAGVPISGSLKIGKKWTYKGKKYSYVNARCETGRLQARGEFAFADGTRLSGTFLRPCTVRR
ncbi:MAG: hypothetical protein H0X42_12365 [Solirubrobacterales bacterium]|nr:hypothetical protein [Solirubrobacterales bacterium]